MLVVSIPISCVGCHPSDTTSLDAPTLLARQNPNDNHPPPVPLCQVTPGRGNTDAHIFWSVQANGRNSRCGGHTTTTTTTTSFERAQRALACGAWSGSCEWGEPVWRVKAGPEATDRRRLRGETPGNVPPSTRWAAPVGSGARCRQRRRAGGYAWYPRARVVTSCRTTGCSRGSANSNRAARASGLSWSDRVAGASARITRGRASDATRVEW
jgi:hypothetical protein